MTRAKVLYFSGEIPQGDPEGDQQDLFRKLHLLSKERTHTVLASFLESVTSAVRDECSRLPQSQKVLIPSFESVLDLTDHVLDLRKTAFGAAIERVLVIVFQLGSFIAYHEAKPLEYDFQPSNTFLIARGPGLLSAAAISLSPSLSMIPSISEDIARIAFRFGLVVDQACRSLEVSPDEINSEGAWIYCAYGVEEDAAVQAVERFNSEKAYPETNAASIFNVDGKSVSVGGPPSTLKALFSESEYFKQAKAVPMKKVQGMWHTGRVYSTEHVQQIVPEIQSTHHLYLDLFSPVTGSPIKQTQATPALEQIMEEMLTQRIRWDKTIEGVTLRLKHLSCDTIQLIAIQPSHYVESLLDHWRAEIPPTEPSSQDMMSAVMDLPLGQSPPRDAKSSKIAVVGMACRFPDGADDPEKFWELLVQGRDAHSPVPPDRFDVDTHTDPAGKKPNASKTPYGCFVDSPGQFDAMFFGMSPREAEQTDPMHRLALVTAYEALESAGYVHGRGRVHTRRVGTFYGQASDDYREVNSGQDIKAYFIPGGCRAFAPGRINYFFKFWGPSFSVDTACSSSLAAIQAACTSLWSGDVDMALTGGLNIITNSDVYAGLSNGHFLSTTGNCKTWDEKADGYCRADGVGSVVLKRLEDAEADNDNILGVVLAAATDHSAEAVSITHPHDVAQSHLYRQVARRAGVDPLSVGYVEMHGTGTQAGDTNEMRSVTDVFAPASRRRSSPLHIGAVKANVGHGEAAAGIMGFMKTMLVLQKGLIPPHIGIKTRLNPALPGDLAERGVVIPYNASSWQPRIERKRLAMVNNFGAAGGNTSIIVEETTPRPRAAEDTREAHPITISAKTALSLQENIKRLIGFVESNVDISVADVSYTLTARKSHYNYRVSVLATTLADIATMLRPHIETAITLTPHSGKQPHMAFAFTGQGTFYLGIGAQLYRDSALFRQQLLQLDHLSQRQGFLSFLSIVTGTCPPEHVSTVTMHLAIVSVEIALARLWGSYGITPDVVVGHSLGEYAALAVSGVLSDSATVFLVGMRAQLLTSACTPRTHAMLTVRTSVENVTKAAAGLPFEVACINGPNETVVGGPISDMKTISDSLTAAGHRAIILDVPHAYHTSQMDCLLEEFVERSQGIEFKKPRIPIISPQHGRVLTEEDTVDISYLASSTRATVNFAGALEGAWSSGVISSSTIWLEVGHHPTNTGFITRTLPSTRLACPSLHRDADNWKTLAKTLTAFYAAGVNIDWNEYHRPFEPGLRLVDVPTYAWNNKNYWIQYRGDWNLTKGRSDTGLITSSPVQPNHSSSIHRIVSETYSVTTAQVSAETNITDPSLQGAIDGHAMNGHGVVSSFLHADMAYTLATYVLQKAPKNLPTPLGLNVTDFEYHEPVVKQRDTKSAQLIMINAEADFDQMSVHVKWYNPATKHWYAHATVLCQDTAGWLSDWTRQKKIVSSRIDDLNAMANTGRANKLSTDLAYSLFAKLVRYSEMYQTMQWVTLNQDEAVTEVLYPEHTSGAWTVPPHFIDGVASLPGFILNGGTHYDNKNNFFVTPSWKSMRFAKPLSPGGRYQAYVAMVPGGDGHSFDGDVYVLQGGEVVGLVEAIKFLQWPRSMLDRFFSPPDLPAKAPALPSRQGERQPRPVVSSTPPYSDEAASPLTIDVHNANGSQMSATKSTSPQVLTPGTSSPPEQAARTDVIGRAIDLLAEELAVDIGLLTDEAQVSDLGLDSLMSLVMSTRFREELGIEIRDAFFLEISTIGDLKKMLG
ncbi:hypothetical protein KVR01_011797 [Diaporthe batatas]|uniref:uncharacterized protein n=1 Tax=Diaporthe batatas TaxID=748121 RepID=UPI001D057DB5|nr:uncharacterized protein KVR01_011797 [Diaporthe batatas]KAG8158675.1 hypothetical protein KVR01_011797 [Diaporthe batatas]